MTHFEFDTTAEGVAAIFVSEIRGKTVLITGISPGSIGAEAALQIAQQQPKLLILAGRNLTKVRESDDAIKSAAPNTSLRLLELSLASRKQVKKAAEEVNRCPEPIDVLIKNAAIMAAPFLLTEDGLENQFEINHIAHFLFTTLITEKIFEAGKGARMAKTITSGNYVGWFVEHGKTIRNPTFKWKTAPQGALTHLVAAFDPSIADQNGAFLTDGQVHMENCQPHAKDKGSAARLWTLSETIVGQEF